MRDDASAGTLSGPRSGRPAVVGWLPRAVSASVIVLAAVAWLHFSHARALSQAANRLASLREARTELAQGYLHLSLAGEPGTPFDRGQGLALLNQAIATFDRAAASLGGEQRQAADGFRRSVSAFGERLAQWRRATLVHAAEATALRIAFADLERQAGALDDATSQALAELDRRLDQRFAAALALAALALTVLAFMASASARAELAAVAARDESEEHLRRGQALLLAVTEGTSDAVYVKDRAGRYLMFNSGASRIVGRPSAEVIGRDDTAIFPAAEAKALMANDQLVMESGAAQTYEEHLTCDGEARVFLATKGPVRDANGHIIGLFGIARDITDLRRAELEHRERDRQMEQTQRLESLGVLAGGIAHDFNNILMAALGHCEAAREVIAEGSPASDDLSQVQVAVHRAAELCRQLMAYAGRASFAAERVCLGDLIDELGQLLRTSISRKAELALNVAPDLPALRGDPSQLRQVVMNLILNASDALGDQPGRIEVSLTEATVTASDILAMSLPGDMAPGRCLRLVCRDTGCGMDEATLARVFEPFFTTKFAGRGLGLAAVVGIIGAHRGALDVRSEPGQGTTFTVIFPVDSAAGTEAQPTDRPTATPWQGQGLVLLVEDEEQVRAICERMLKRIGFEVLTAADGLEALAIHEQRGDQIDLVLLDLTMPRLDGAETLRRLRERSADLPVILASGFSIEDMTARFAGAGLRGALQKPYSLIALRDVLAASCPELTRTD